jgi:hypothetical protein
MKPMRLALCVLSVCALLGCYRAGPERVGEVEGHAVFKIACRSDRTRCQKQATAACDNGGYKVVEEEKLTGSLAAPDSFGLFTWWVMHVQCGGKTGGELAEAQPSAEPASETSEAPLVENPSEPDPSTPPSTTASAQPAKSEPPKVCKVSRECPVGAQCLIPDGSDWGVCTAAKYETQAEGSGCRVNPDCGKGRCVVPRGASEGVCVSDASAKGAH